MLRDSTEWVLRSGSAPVRAQAPSHGRTGMKGWAWMTVMGSPLIRHYRSRVEVDVPVLSGVRGSRRGGMDWSGRDAPPEVMVRARVCCWVGHAGVRNLPHRRK